MLNYMSFSSSEETHSSRPATIYVTEADLLLHTIHTVIKEMTVMQNILF